jgi:hypothetical protein
MTFIIHQSDLQSWARCPEAWHLERQGARRKSLSATAYGVVMHHALHVGAREGNNVQVALDTFDYYWHPHHIEALSPPVDTWILRDSYGSLLTTGREAIRRFFDLVKVDHGELLALEYEFIVPLEGVLDPSDGSTVQLAGTIDRLLARKKRGIPILDFDDLKTGKKPTYLRHNIQGTTYAFASTLPEFWMGNPAFHTEGFGDRGQELYLRFASAPRHFNWWDLKGMSSIDGGFRGPRDYARMKYACQQVVSSIRGEIFPLALTGAVCQYCDFRDSCAGVGVDEKEGDPFK